MTQRLVTDDLFDADCRDIAFPRPTRCARCTGENVDAHRLATDGVRWTFTIQNFRPKEPYNGPAKFVPFGVGYVNLGGEILVEGRLTEGDADRLRIGMPMRVVPDPYTTEYVNPIQIQEGGLIQPHFADGSGGLLGSGMGESVGVGAGFYDVAAEGEPVHDRRA